MEVAMAPVEVAMAPGRLAMAPGKVAMAPGKVAMAPVEPAMAPVQRAMLEPIAHGQFYVQAVPEAGVPGATPALYDIFLQLIRQPDPV